jgi:beta-lactamase regulating signal transducer with metallopeptidase domain
VFVLPEGLARELERVRAVLKVGPVEVRSSGELRSPATVSWPRAMLLVPEDFAGCAEEDAAAAMGHELAHVRRGDFWVNVLCEVLAVAAWWHPAMHWVKRRVAEAREVCCDELAAEVTRGRAAYAQSLVSLAGTSVSSE